MCRESQKRKQMINPNKIKTQQRKSPLRSKHCVRSQEGEDLGNPVSSSELLNALFSARQESLELREKNIRLRESALMFERRLMEMRSFCDLALSLEKRYLSEDTYVFTHADVEHPDGDSLYCPVCLSAHKGSVMEVNSIDYACCGVCGYDIEFNVQAADPVSSTQIDDIQERIKSASRIARRIGERARVSEVG